MGECYRRDDSWVEWPAVCMDDRGRRAVDPQDCAMSETGTVGAALDRIADALEAIAAAIHRHADVHLYVNDPEGEEGELPQSRALPDGFRGMR